MIELITRAGWRSDIKDLCVMEMLKKSTGEHLSWLFEDSIESEGYEGGVVFKCKSDA